MVDNDDQQEAAAAATDTEAYDPSKDPRRRAKSKDPAWKYAFWPDLERKDLVQCTLCNKRVHAGVGRLKRHLAGGHNDVEKCPKATAEIRKEMHDYLKKNSRKFKAMMLDEEDEAGDGDGEGCCFSISKKDIHQEIYVRIKTRPTWLLLLQWFQLANLIYLES